METRSLGKGSESKVQFSIGVKGNLTMMGKKISQALRWTEKVTSRYWNSGRQERCLKKSSAQPHTDIHPHTHHLLLPTPILKKSICCRLTETSKSKNEILITSAKPAVVRTVTSARCNDDSFA